MISATTATGAKPPENIYKRAVMIANQAKLPVAVELGRAWVAAYPSRESWSNAIGLYQNLNKPDVAATLDLLRLMRAVGAMSSPEHYSLYSTVAADRGIYAEAQAVVDEGLAKNAFTASSPVIKDVIAGLKAKAKPTAADLETATNDAKTGAALLRVGDRYYGAGNYAKAAELYRMAKGKPEVDQGLVDLHLGMALARSGDKAGAAAALGQVSGAHAPIAQYWLIYVNQMA
jgi:tetratricopeptide (TPR) repeat protein